MHVWNYLFPCSRNKVPDCWTLSNFLTYWVNGALWIQIMSTLVTSICCCHAAVMGYIYMNWPLWVNSDLKNIHYVYGKLFKCAGSVIGDDKSPRSVIINCYVATPAAYWSGARGSNGRSNCVEIVEYQPLFRHNYTFFHPR